MKRPFPHTSTATQQRVYTPSRPVVTEEHDSFDDEDDFAEYLESQSMSQATPTQAPATQSRPTLVLPPRTPVAPTRLIVPTQNIGSFKAPLPMSSRAQVSQLFSSSSHINRPPLPPNRSMTSQINGRPMTQHRSQSFQKVPSNDDLRNKQYDGETRKQISELRGRVRYLSVQLETLEKERNMLNVQLLHQRNTQKDQSGEIERLNGVIKLKDDQIDVLHFKRNENINHLASAESQLGPRPPKLIRTEPPARSAMGSTRQVLTGWQGVRPAAPARPGTLPGRGMPVVPGVVPSAAPARPPAPRPVRKVSTTVQTEDLPAPYKTSCERIFRGQCNLLFAMVSEEVSLAPKHFSLDCIFDRFDGLFVLNAADAIQDKRMTPTLQPSDSASTQT